MTPDTTSQTNYTSTITDDTGEVEYTERRLPESNDYTSPDSPDSIISVTD